MTTFYKAFAFIFFFQCCISLSLAGQIIDNDIPSDEFASESLNLELRNPPVFRVDPKKPDVPEVSNDYYVGSLNGSFEVTESGAAEYNLNI